LNRLIDDMGFWYEGHTLSYPLIFADCTVTYSIMELKVLLEYYQKNSWWKNYTIALMDFESKYNNAG